MAGASSCQTVLHPVANASMSTHCQVFGRMSFTEMRGSSQVGHDSNAVVLRLNPSEVGEPRYPHVIHQPSCTTQPSAAPQSKPSKPVGRRVLKAEPWLERPFQNARRAAYGLQAGRAHEFAEACEYVGLGSFCAVSRALQALDLKNFSYPFDWTRSSLTGLLHCLDHNFSDFLTHTSCKDHESAGVCFSCAWGGSFWHHDPTEPQSRQDFARRIARLYGQGEVPLSKPRVFVRSINSTDEVYLIPKLMQTLRWMLPGVTVYLLLLVDNQPAPGFMRLQGVHDVVIYKTGETLFSNGGAAWTMQEQAEAYGEAIALATHLWADGDLQPRVEDVASLPELFARLVPFFGGDASTEMYWPSRPTPTQEVSRSSHCVVPSKNLSHQVLHGAALFNRMAVHGGA